MIYIVVYILVRKFFCRFVCFNNSSCGKKRKRRGHFTELASIELVDRIYGHLENNDIPCAVYCHLSKAFDCLLHPILLDKLEYYGIRGIPLQLIKSYLQNRIQFV